MVAKNDSADVIEDDPQIAEEDVAPVPRRKKKRGLLARIFGLDEDSNEPVIQRGRPQKDGAVY